MYIERISYKNILLRNIKNLFNNYNKQKIKRNNNFTNQQLDKYFCQFF